MTSIKYYGPFGEHIHTFIELKQSIGYKYITEAENLRRFDSFTLQHYKHSTVLSKEIILDWCKKKTYEAQANQGARLSIIRQFGKYLANIGVESFIIPEGYYPKEKQYSPHIYTKNELDRFFSETDKCRYSSQFPHRHLIMPVFFRMLYACGLRVSEARFLKVSEVDVNTGILTINQSKKDKKRLVPVSDSILKRLRDFTVKVHQNSNPDDYYFPALKEKAVTIGNVYKNFRKFLWRAGISHRGRGNGPRIHDFRHTYAVHCLKTWVRQEKNMLAYIPILKTYLGHDSFKETAYYLRLTADVFPDIIIKLESAYLDLVPELGGNSNETD